MRKIKILVAALALLGIGAALAQAASVTWALTVSYQGARVNADGSATFQVKYVTAGGSTVLVRQLSVDAAGTQVVDEQGTVIATPAPAALVSAVSTFNAQISSLVAAAATGGKLNP